MNAITPLEKTPLDRPGAESAIGQGQALKSIPAHRILDKLRDGIDRHVIFYRRGETTKVTFSELHDEVSSLASRMKSLGIKSGTRVGVIAENGRFALLVDLALLQLGCTSVQVPEGSISTAIPLLEQCSPEYVITSNLFSDVLCDDRYMELARLPEFVAYKTLNHNLVPGLEGQDTPAIIFSSGTTGRVKIILVNGEGIVYNANVFFSSIEHRLEDMFLIFLPLSNYQQKLLIYGCILSRLSFCLTDAPNVLGALKHIRPTLFLAPPVFYETALKMVQEPVSVHGAAGCHSIAGGMHSSSSVAQRLKDVFGGSIRIAWTGMAPIPRAILAAYHEADVPLYEAYGMTEYGPIAANRSGQVQPGSVGRPLVAGSVKIAADGEIIVSSEFPLTTGYLGEPSGDENKVYAGNRTIATGDIGYLDDDGYLFIQGRKKDILITSAGIKIHPQTIESLFRDMLFIKHAVLMDSGATHLGLLVAVDKVDADILDLVTRRVAELNGGVCKQFPIRKWRLVVAEFTPENGLLTRNMKLHRGNIIARYRDAVFS